MAYKKNKVTALKKSPLFPAQGHK